MSTALTPLATVPKLATTAVRYITTTPAPEPASITLHPGTYEIDIQPAVRRNPVEVIGALLIWTHRLTGITGTWWHTLSGDLHISLTGRGPHGIRFRVYSSFPHDDAREHVAPPRGEQESVTPDELYHLALALRAERSVQ